MKKHNLIEINDIFYINEKFKDINKNLQIFYNTTAKRYELHDFSQKNSFVISYYKYPDEGFLKKYFQTKIENIERTLQEIENYNEKLTQNKNNLICDKSSQQLKEVVNYAIKKGDGEISKTQISNILS